MKIVLALGLLLGLMVACKSTEQQATVPHSIPVVDTAIVAKVDTLIYYERTACFGMCPIFSCVFFTDGKANYYGHNFVDRIGHFQTTFDPTALHKVKQLVRDMNYFALQSTYDHTHVTDLPSVITRMHFDEKDLTVVNRYKGPKELNALYQELDQVIQSLMWQSAEN